MATDPTQNDPLRNAMTGGAPTDFAALAKQFGGVPVSEAPEQAPAQAPAMAGAPPEMTTQPVAQSGAPVQPGFADFAKQFGGVPEEPPQKAWGDEFLTTVMKGQEDFLNQFDNPLGTMGHVLLGGEKGLLRTLHDIGELPLHALKMAGMDIPDIEFEMPEVLENTNTAQSVGGAVEGLAEFIMTDGMLKGLSMAGKLDKTAKIMKTLEESPRLMAAFKTGVGALRMGAAQAALTGLHGGTAEEALESGAYAGALGGAFGGAQALKQFATTPGLQRAITGAELIGGGTLAYEGGKEVMTPQQEGETPQQARERQVGGAVQAGLSLLGMRSAAKDQPVAMAERAKARNAMQWLKSVEDDLYWASDAAKGDVAGTVGRTDDYRQVLKTALPQLREAMIRNPNATTPKEFAGSLQQRSDGIDGMLKAHAQRAMGYDGARLTGVDQQIFDAFVKFQKENPGKYTSKEQGAALDKLLNFVYQDTNGKPPSLYEAEHIRQRWNEESGEAPYRGERTTAENTFRQLASGVMREAIDAKYEQLGVKNVQEWRKQQAALIDVKDQINLAQKAMEKANHASVLPRIARMAGWGALSYIFPPMRLMGEIFGGMEGLGALREIVSNREKNPEVLLSRAIKNAQKLDAQGVPTGAITPEFQRGVGNLPPGAMQPTTPARLTGEQQELTAGPSPLFSVEGTPPQPQEFPKAKLDAISKAIKPFIDTINDPNATAAEKAVARQKLKEIQDRYTPPKGPSSAQEPTASGQQTAELPMSGFSPETDIGLEGTVKAMSLRKQIADLGDKFPKERERLQAELKHQEAINREYYDQPVEIPSEKSVMPLLDLSIADTAEGKQWKSAIDNTPYVKQNEDGSIEVPVRRFQKPEQAGEPSARTGVFFLADDSPYAKYYKGKNWYGGSEEIRGTVRLKNPLVVKGQTGGIAPERAFDHIKGDMRGRRASKILHEDVVSAVLRPNDELRRKFINEAFEKWGGDPDMVDHILDTSREGNQLVYAVQEHIIAHALREAGYDGVVSYSGRGSKYRVAEVFDVSRNKYPDGTVDQNGILHFTSRGPVEMKPEMAEIGQKAGLEYRGSDDMGLSHFHDPETNHTYSIATTKATPDALIEKRQAKAAPASGEGSLAAMAKRREHYGLPVPQIEGDVPHLPNAEAAKIGTTPERTARHELGHVAAAALFSDITAKEIVLPGHKQVGKTAAATTRMDVTDLYRRGGGQLTPETYPQLIKMATMGGAVDHLIEGIDYKTNKALAGDRGYIERILKEVGIPRSEWETIADNMFQESIKDLNKPELLDLFNKFGSGREPDLDVTLLASNKRVTDFTNEFKKAWENNNGKIIGSTKPGQPAQTVDLGRTESKQSERIGESGRTGQSENPQEHLAELRAKDEGQAASNVKGSSVPLMENPLKVKGTGEGKRVTTVDVAKALNQFSKKQNPRLKPGSEPAEMVARAKALAEDEAKYQLAQSRTGTEWYTKEIDEHDAFNAEVNPALSNPVKNSLFKFAEAVLSSGQKPYANLKSALKAFESYESTGEFPRSNPVTGKSWGPRGVDAYGYAFDTLNRLVKEKGEQGTVDWLLAEHPIKELREMAPNSLIAGKQTDMMPGAMVLGAKRGPFALNLHKIEAQFTADMWVSRTWNRWMGTTEVDAKTGEVMSDAPRNKTERSLMKQSFQETADNLGLTTSSLQAVLWYYEQSLYSAHGTPKESWSFSDAAKRVRDERNDAASKSKSLTVKK